MGKVGVWAWFIGLMLWGSGAAGGLVAIARGDLDCDGEVGLTDAEIVVGAVFGIAPASPTCAGVDVNADGGVSAADLAALVAQIVAAPTPSPTPTVTPALGPIVTFLGMAAADGTPIDPVQVGADGTPVYQRSIGAGFYVVVEADRGATGSPVGLKVFDSRPGDTGARPDLQVEVSRPLGAGDRRVCAGGGVPGFDPEDFSERKEVTDALNDLGCGFAVNTNSVRACTVNRHGSPAFMSDARPEVQFCLLIDGDNEFATGDTRIVVQVRDAGGEIGPRRAMVLRVGKQTVPTSTVSPSPTWTPPRIPTTTPSPTASRLLTPTATGQPGRSPTATASVPAVATASPSASAPAATPTRTGTPVGPGSPTPSLTVTASPTASRVASAGTTPTPTTRATATQSGVATPSVTPTPSSSRVPAATSTPSPSVTAVAPTQTGLPSATASRTLSPSRTATRTATVTYTRTATSTPRPFLSVTASPTRTPTRTRVPSRTATESPTPTATRTPSSTRTATATPLPSGTPTATRTATETPTVTPSRTPSSTRTPTATPTPSRTATSTLTRTITATPTVTGTPTHTVPPEPFITFFGVARADGTVVETPTAMLRPGVPIYERPRFGFFLVVEGQPGATGARMGTSAYEWDPDDPSELPDVQVIVSRPLGNGSAAVCDDLPDNRGGVPATVEFTLDQAMADAVNDLGCRFKDGKGEPGGRGASDACTRLRNGIDAFWGEGTTVQFCSLIDRPFEFPSGDTLVRARLRDEAGHVSHESALVVRTR